MTLDPTNWKDCVLVEMARFLVEMARFLGTLPDGDYPPLIAGIRLVVQADRETLDGFLAESPLTT